RTHDHKIPLVPNTPPINIRPYRQSPSHKTAIEVMVKELIDSGVIRASQSSFSSSIVMVKKNDGTWRMHVDYKQLNKYTLKDKFPIPVTKELMDELGASVVFSKLDLRFGYHQIRMNEEDIDNGRSLCSSTTSLTDNENNKLFAKQSKCSFAVKKVEYLGHVMSGEGVAIDPSKIEAIKNWQKLSCSFYS
ncbi:hypothetical protein Tco_1535080, partial [Tanacetum coccineum]